MEQVLIFSVDGGNIDCESGLIRGVSLITEGAVTGHDCFADARTNQTVLAACQKLGRVKCKLNHGTDVTSIVGYLHNFFIDGAQVKADLQLLEECEQYKYILELASKLKNNFGLSIAFKPEFEQIDGTRFVRCSEIYSADIVDSPACNPAGLFSKNNTEDVEDTDNSDKADEDANDEDVKLSEVHKILERYNADLAGVKERLKLMASTVAAINNKIDSAKIELLSRVEAEFSSKLTEQAKQLEAKMASAEVLACRKLAATGIPMYMVPSYDVGSESSVLDQLNSIVNPSEKAEFFAKNKAEIYKAYQANLTKRLSR